MMVKNPPENMPRIIPYLFYKDLSTALEWLSSAFGLKTELSLPDKEGTLVHAEMRLVDGVVMMGLANEQFKTRSAKDLPAVNQSLYIYVDDLDAHYRTAKAAGAMITMEPAEMFWGDRMYAALDLEGHQWSFAQHVRDVPPEDIKMPEHG